MNKLYLYLFEPFNNLRKWIYITLITILFLSAFFFFLAAYSNVINTENFTVSLRNNETYLSYWQMYIDHPIETYFSDGPMFHEEWNELEREERRRIKIETDQLICDLYNMQNDDFILEYNIHRSFTNNGFFDEACVQADETFFEHEYLPIFKGRSITKEDFEEIRNAKSSNLVINVIAGYSFSEKYELGDIIRGSDKEFIQYVYGDEESSDYTLRVYDQDSAAYRVVGFIEKGITVSNSSGSIHKTDGYVFVPHIPEIGIFFPEEAKVGKGAPASDITCWKILIRNGKVDEYAEKINQMLDGLFIDKYYDLNDSYNQAYVILDEVVSVRNDSFLIMAIILFIFSVSGIIVSTVNKFKRNIKSYTIHMTIGATNKDIYIFAAVEMLMQIIIALVIMHIPYLLSAIDFPVIKFINRNIPYMSSPIMYILLLLFAVIFIAVTVAVTAFCLRKYSIAEILKGKE